MSNPHPADEQLAALRLLVKLANTALAQATLLRSCLTGRTSFRPAEVRRYALTLLATAWALEAATDDDGWRCPVCGHAVEDDDYWRGDRCLRCALEGNCRNSPAAPLAVNLESISPTARSDGNASPYRSQRPDQRPGGGAAGYQEEANDG